MGIFPPPHGDSSLLPIGRFLHSDRIVPMSISPPYGDSSLLPIGGFLHSDRIVPMSISPPYGDSSLLLYGRIPPSHTLGGSYLLPHECLSSTSSGGILLPYKWISLLFSPTVIASALRRRLLLSVLHTPIAPPSDLRSVVRDDGARVKDENPIYRVGGGKERSKNSRESD
jgi:hypothetical protein